MINKLLRKLGSRQGWADIRFFISRVLVNPLLRPCGFTLIADHFYQPIPNRAEVISHANTPRLFGGCVFNYEEQIPFVRQLLTQYKAEINSESDLGAAGYRMSCGGFGSGDAEMLYCLIRHLKPTRIVEVGAGTSTQVIVAALRKNAGECGHSCDLTSIDPYPSKEAVETAGMQHAGVTHNVIAARVQDVPVSKFQSLGENDILFVDSSHVFKAGSDVEHEFHNIYPSLRRGVWVHVHDIFLPFDYPPEWNNKKSFFWNEQYILEAFLQFNTAFRIRAALNMIARHDPAVFSDSIERYLEQRTPGSFWMQRVAGQ
jgi:predicted O-methyltransferase YrrM